MEYDGHKGKKYYSCETCDFQATKMRSLTKNKQSRHESNRYPCDLCDYQATASGSLITHKQKKHEGKKYPCDYLAAYKGA